MNTTLFAIHASDQTRNDYSNTGAMSPKSTTPERTSMSGIGTLKRLTSLLLILTGIAGLTATRGASAQNLNLGNYTNFLTLVDNTTHKSNAAQLAVYQDNFGDLSGWLYMDSTDYSVTGTLSWAGPYWSNWYWLDITATWASESYWVLFSSQINMSGWVYNEGNGWIEFYTGNYTWESGSLFNRSTSYGTYSGYGFVPPR